MALPNKTFWVNYNARNYDTTNHKIPKESGQLFDQDLVLPGAVTFTDDHITISDNKRIDITFDSTAQNIFNRTTNTASMTFIAKAKGTRNKWFVANRNYGTVGWMVMHYPSDYEMAYIGGSNKYSSNTEPMIMAWRNGTNGQQYIAISDNVTGTPYQTTDWVGQETTAMHFFGGGDGFEYWTGDFYWLYISPETLTDAEIQQVIVYNDNLHTFESDKSSLRFEASGGTDTLEITAETGWTCTTPTAFTMSTTTGTTGTTTITVTAPANTGSTKIEEIITFTDADNYTFDVKLRQKVDGAGYSYLQIGQDTIDTFYIGDLQIEALYMGEEQIYSQGPFVGLKVSPQSLRLNNATNTANITIRSSENWTITDDSGGWLSYSTTTGGTGKTVVTVTAATTQAERTATITVTSANYSATVGVTDKARLYMVPNDEIWYHQTGNDPNYPFRPASQNDTWFVETDMTTPCWIISNTYDSNYGWWKIKWSGPLGRTAGTGFGFGSASKLTEVMLPETMLVDCTDNWRGSTNLKKICYGASIERFDTGTFEFTYFEEIYIYAPTCPTIENPNSQWNGYGGTGVTLHYPAGSDYSSFPLPPNSTRIGDL